MVKVIPMEESCFRGASPTLCPDPEYLGVSESCSWVLWMLKAAICCHLLSEQAMARGEGSQGHGGTTAFRRRIALWHRQWHACKAVRMSVIWSAVPGRFLGAFSLSAPCSGLLSFCSFLSLGFLAAQIPQPKTDPCQDLRTAGGSNPATRLCPLHQGSSGELG